MLLCMCHGMQALAQYGRVTETNANNMGMATQFERIMSYLECRCSPDSVHFAVPMNDSAFFALADKYLSTMHGVPKRAMPAVEKTEENKAAPYVQRTFVYADSNALVYYAQVRVLFSAADLENGKTRVEKIDVSTGSEIRPFTRALRREVMEKVKKPVPVLLPRPAIETR